MRIIHVAFAIIVFNLMLTWLSAIGIVRTGFSTDAGNPLHQFVSWQIIENIINIQSTGTVIDVGLGIVKTAMYIGAGISLFIEILIRSTIESPIRMLQNPPFSIPSFIIDTLIIIQNAIYALGLAEFLRGFSTTT